jgi:hypothetical protein
VQCAVITRTAEIPATAGSSVSMSCGSWPTPKPSGIAPSMSTGITAKAMQLIRRPPENGGPAAGVNATGRCVASQRVPGAKAVSVYSFPRKDLSASAVGPL